MSTNIISRICSMAEVLTDLSRRVESLEHFINQQTILVDTLNDIMEELKKQER